MNRPSLLNWRTLWSLLFVGCFILSLYSTGLLEQDLINEGGWSLVLRFLLAATRPELAPDFLWLTWEATLKTLAYAVCGTFFSLLLGLVAGVLSSEVWWQSTHRGRFATPWLAIRAVLAIPRAIHELIWGLFFINIFGLDPLVAVLAIAIPFGAITAKVFSEILDETPRHPLLALFNSGVPPLHAFAYSILPQAFSNLLSYSFYRFECSIRSAAVLGIIGAGGLGYQIYLSLQSLRYEQVWTLIMALVVLSGSTDLCSALVRRRLDAPSRLDLNVLNLSQRKKSGVVETRHVASFQESGDRSQKSGRFFPTPLHPYTLTPLHPYTPTPLHPYTPTPLTSHPSALTPYPLIIAALLLISFWYIQADFTKLWSPRTAQLLAAVIRDAFPPDFSQLNHLLALSAQTLAMSILAITIAGLGGILLSFLAASNFLLPGGILDIGGKQYRMAIVVLVVTRLLLLFARAIPAPIWALIFLFVLFPGILPGAIALCIHNLGILGRLMAEVIENLDERPVRSLKALGASPTSTLLYGVLPRTLPRFFAYILYRWEVCMRSTVIVGLVGAGGLGRLLTEQLSSFDYKGIVTTLICFTCLTFVVDLISASVRRLLR